MAELLALEIQASSPAAAETLGRFLAEDTRPLFEEDVTEADQPLFAVVEAVEYPDRVLVKGGRIQVHWVDRERFGLGDLVPLLELPDYTLVAAYETADDPMEVDEDDLEAWYWVAVERGYERLSPRQARQRIPQALWKRLQWVPGG